MLGATFATVSSDNKTFCLKDLKVQCQGTYIPEYNRRWRGGCTAPTGFMLKLLDNTGHADWTTTYYWQYTKSGDEFAPTVVEGWFMETGNGTGIYEKLEGEALKAVKIPAGQGMYIFGNGNQLNIPAPEL